MRGRADMPSAKKSLGSSGSYLGCTAIFWRQATSNIVRPSAARDPLRACARGSLADWAARDDKRSPRDIGHLPRIERLQKIPRLVEIELRIARLDHQKKFVARRLIESRHVEHRVIRHRQSVEREHAEDGGKCGDENGAFESDRNPRRPTVERAPADIQRIADDIRIPAHEESANPANHAAA